jgi:hypothetical protein
MKVVYIEDIQDLEKMRKIVEDQDSSDYIFELVEDLDLKGIKWYSIGYVPNGASFIFDGIFKGNHHVIKNLVSTTGGAGLIYQNNGTIENLYLDNTCKICGRFICCGSICGENNGTIRGCKSSATVKGDSSVGGICGMSIRNFFVTPEVPASIENCVFYGVVKGKSEVGGICGHIEGKANDLFNSGIVIGETQVGGIAGEMVLEGKYKNFTNNGYVYGKEKVDLVCYAEYPLDIGNKIVNGRILSKNDPVLYLNK